MATTDHNLVSDADYTLIVASAVAAFRIQNRSHNNVSLICAASLPAKADLGLKIDYLSGVSRNDLPTGNVYARTLGAPAIIVVTT